LFLIQVLNGLQFGVLLFLIAAGLTLVFGVMNFINLAHGTQYMLGAYLAVAFYGLVGTFVGALLLALATAVVCAAAVLADAGSPQRIRGPDGGIDLSGLAACHHRQRSWGGGRLVRACNL